MIALTRAQLNKLWPNAPADLTTAVAAQSRQVFARYGINTPLRLAHFMAQISHESNGGTITEENLNYTTPQRIKAVWPTRFTVETAQAYVRRPRALANKVYNGRMGNKPGSDDGYNYRGRGLLQITGRDSYRRMGEKLGLDLVGQPTMAYEPEHSFEIAACEFRDLKCLPAADRDDVLTVTKRVNGGTNGLSSRKAWLAKWKQAIPELPGDPDEVEENDADPRTIEAAPKPLIDSKIAGAATASGVLATLSQANEAAGVINETKEQAANLGVLEIIGHLAHRPMFWVLIAITVAAVLIVYWRWQHAQEGL